MNKWETRPNGRNFPGGPMGFHWASTGGKSSTPGLGTKILHEKVKKKKQKLENKWEPASPLDSGFSDSLGLVESTGAWKMTTPSDKVQVWNVPLIGHQGLKEESQSLETHGRGSGERATGPNCKGFQFSFLTGDHQRERNEEGSWQGCTNSMP